MSKRVHRFKITPRRNYDSCYKHFLSNMRRIKTFYFDTPTEIRETDQTMLRMQIEWDAAKALYAAGYNFGYIDDETIVFFMHIER
jgi:hypothetical protein